nr:acyl-CoA dehydrogenase family protein [Nocardia sp. XZ_19_231]
MMLRDATRDLLAAHASLATVRAELNSDSDVDPKFWRLTADLGWSGLALPEEYGGAGQGSAELALVAEETGRALSRGPFLPTTIVGHAVAVAGSPRTRDEVLPLLASGPDWASWAFAEPGEPWTPDGIHATARREGDSLILHGCKTAVQDAGGARWLLVTARTDDGTVVTVLVDRDSAGLTTRRQQVLDPTRNFYEVRLDGVRVQLDRALDNDACTAQQLLDYAAVVHAAESLGVLTRLLELTVEYVGTRIQFGKPIGSFQAVKHACADMAILVHGARAATYYAAMAIDAGSADAAQAACVAASHTSAAAFEVAGRALQMHGGIGFTWEHDLHLYLRRAETDAVVFGDTAVHRDRLCTLMQQAPASA